MYVHSSWPFPSSAQPNKKKQNLVCNRGAFLVWLDLAGPVVCKGLVKLHAGNLFYIEFPESRYVWISKFLFSQNLFDIWEIHILSTFFYIFPNVGWLLVQLFCCLFYECLTSGLMSCLLHECGNEIAWFLCKVSCKEEKGLFDPLFSDKWCMICCFVCFCSYPATLFDKLQIHLSCYLASKAPVSLKKKKKGFVFVCLFQRLVWNISWVWFPWCWCCKVLYEYIHR